MKIKKGQKEETWGEGETGGTSGGGEKGKIRKLLKEQFSLKVIRQCKKKADLGN